MSTNWLNDDGLLIKYGPDRHLDSRPGVIQSNDPVETMEVPFTYDNLPGAVNGDYGIVNIPAGAYLVSAYIEVGTQFAGGTSLAIGTEQNDGTAIDADGIFTDAELPLANLTVGAVIAASAGADVGTIIDASNDAYVVVTATGTFTAGTAKLVIKYIKGY
jgi:hypothetical protein